MKTAEFYNPATNSWTPAASLALNRTRHVAALLPSGHVVVVGGIGSDGAETSAERYDPVANAWTAAGALVARHGIYHSATPLATGTILVTGGNNGAASYSTAAELYDAGLAPAASRQPVLATVNGFLATTSALVATGSGLRPTPGASNDATNGSPTNLPVFEVERIDNRQTRLVPGDGTFSITDATFIGRGDAFAGFPAGPVLVRAWVNGIPGTARGSTFATSPGRLAAPVAVGGPQAQLTIASASYDGGATIVQYTVTASPGGIQGTCSAPCTQISIGGLTPGIPYTFTVVAVNAIGAGPASPPSNTVQVGALSTMQLASNANPSLYGQALTFIATISGGAGTPTGSVTFRDGGTPISACGASGVVTLAGGAAACIPGALATGAHALTAEYGGSPTYANSAGATSQVVNKANTSATISAHTPQPVTLGNAIAVSVTLGVSAPGAGTPTGTIQVGDGSANCVITLPATGCNLTPASAGVRTLGAAYSGDANFNGSLAAGVSHTTIKTVVARGAGNMATGRTYQSATLLTDGRLLVAGGVDGNNVTLDSSEIYDPRANAWSAAAPMSSARQQHTATLLPTGKVLVAGGLGVAAGPGSAELFDPATGTWSAAGNLVTARYQHTATLLPGGKVLLAGGIHAGVEGGAAELYDPATNVWTGAASLAAVRVGHTASLLPNGKVLVAGGHNALGYVSNAELFDPATNAWTPAAALGTPRDRHTATLLPGGKLLVAGGYNGIRLAAAELYDPVFDTWSDGGTLLVARLAHSASLLPNGLVLIAGGQTTAADASLELYDPTSGTWTAGGNLATARRDHTATLLANGKVLGVGGDGVGAQFALASTELLDDASGGWSATAQMPVNRDLAAATLLPNGKLLVAGGVNGCYLDSAHLYDAVANAWSTAAPLLAVHLGHTATLLPNGKVLVVGSSFFGPTPAEAYDPASNTWSAAATPGAANRRQHSATLLANGKVLVVGGFSAVVPAEIYDPAQNAWAAAGTPALARRDHAAVLLPNGKVLVVGGDNDNATPHLDSNTAEVYDPATNQWTMAANMHAYRIRPNARLLPNGRVLVTGGDILIDGISTAELYDPASNTWSAKVPLTSGQLGAAAALLPDGKVVVTGGNGGTPPGRAVDLYDPAGNTWSSTASMATAHSGHTLTLLADGRLIATPVSPTSATELFDPGLAPDPARRPALNSVNAFVAPGSALYATGSGFRPIADGSGGSANASPSNAPVFQVQRLDNGQMRFVLNDSAVAMTDSTFTGRGGVFAGFPQGHALVRPWVNGIPGAALITKFGAPQVDIDGNGSYDALTDGVLALHYLTGLTGAALTAGALGPGATRTDPVAVLAYLNDIRPLLDIDGNGQFDAQTDGLLYIRYLFGMRGAALIAGAVGSGATRTTAAAIEAYIASLMQ